MYTFLKTDCSIRNWNTSLLNAELIVLKQRGKHRHKVVNSWHYGARFVAVSLMGRPDANLHGWGISVLISRNLLQKCNEMTVVAR
jgi:hypothetical protein